MVLALFRKNLPEKKKKQHKMGMLKPFGTTGSMHGFIWMFGLFGVMGKKEEIGSFKTYHILDSFPVLTFDLLSLGFFECNY